jgi:hypothetical protein
MPKKQKSLIPLLALTQSAAGYRTYAMAACLFIVGGLEALGVLPKEVADPLKTFFAAGGIAALRAAK